MVEELKLAIKIDDATIEQSLLKQFANAQKMADKVVLDFKNVNFDDKQIEAKFKELQKKAGQNPIDFSISGNTLDMLGQIDKRLTEIFSIGKGKSFIDSSTVADIGKIENKINELDKKYEEAQKKLSSIGSGGISGKDVNLVDNKEFQKLSDNFEKIKGEIDELKQKINTIDIDTEWLNNFTTRLDEELTDTQAKLDNFINDFNSSFEKINTSTSNTLFNEESIRIFEKLFTSIESSLSSIKGVLVDVGDGEELSPLLKTIANIESAIDNLSSSVKGIGLNMNIDFGSDTELEAKAQAKISNALQAYQNLFEHIKMSSAGGSYINNKFFDFDINQFDTPMSKLQAYIKFIKDMREEAKKMFGGKDILKINTDDKYWNRASAAMGQVKKTFNEMKAANDTNPLENIFGKTDLTEVISQLENIVSKLDEISVSAKGFAETFKNGLNVNASVEEIEKLTNRVKELEDELARVKAPTIATASQEPNISSDISSQVKVSDSITDQIVANEKKKQEAYKATTETVMYHAGVISKLNKAETNGRFYGSDRGTGYFGTGHYFVDSNTKHELDNNSSYSSLPYTSIDISKYDNLFKATSDEVADALHTFLKNLTKFTQGSDSFEVSELFSQFQKVFGETTMDIQEFDAKLSQLKAYMQSSNMSDRGDSVSTQFMKSLGYGGVDTRGTKYADTRYGTVIYDLKEESVLQANITDELQKQGQMLEKITYEKGQVFDKSEDTRIQGILDQQAKAKEIETEFNKIFDSTNLNTYNSELDSVNQKLTENKSIINNCKSAIETADEDAKRFAKEMAEFDLHMSDEEIAETANKNKVEYQERIEVLSKEQSLLKDRKQEIESNLDAEYKLANAARERATATVEDRMKDAFPSTEATASVEKLEQVSNANKEVQKAVETSTLAIKENVKVIDNGELPALDELVKKANEAAYELTKGKDIVSQIGKKQVYKVTETDENGKTMERIVGQFSYVEKSLDGQLKNVLATYDESTGRWNEEVLSLATNFEKVGKEIISLDNKINKLEMHRDKMVSEHPNYDTSADDELIDVQKARRNVLEQTIGLYANEKEYVYEVDAFEKKRIENNRTLLALKDQQNNSQKVKMDEKADKQLIKDWEDAIKFNQEYDTALEKTNELLSKLSVPKELESQWLELIDYADKLRSKLANNEIGVSDYKSSIKSKLSEYNSNVGIQQKRDIDEYNSNVKADNANKLEREKQIWNELTTSLDRYATLQKRIASNNALSTDNEEATELLEHIHELQRSDILPTEKLTASNKKIQQINQTVTDLKAKLKESTLDSLQGSIDKYQKIYDQGRTYSSDFTPSEQYIKNLTELKTAIGDLEKYKDTLKNVSEVTIEQEAELKRLVTTCEKASDSFKSLTASEKGASQIAVDKLVQRINKDLDECTNYSKKAKLGLKALRDELESANPRNLKEILSDMINIENAEIRAGRAGRSFFDTLKNSGFHQLAAQMAGMFGFYDVINVGKEAISTIVSLDDALVDLKKTTAMNSTQLEDFYYNANDVAKQMGVTTEEIITQASSWSRLGYSSQEAATTMAKLSSKFASISPGMSTDEAQEGLVSIMKAFDIDPDDVETEIMDKVNVLGNKFAEENQDVIEGLKRSAAAMSAMGQSFTDTAALFTGGMEILQDSESMGTALRTLSMRVRGYDEETNQLSDDLANVTGEVADLTKTAQDSQGVSLFTDTTQEHYRSMVEYLGDIADRWDLISEKNQTELLQKLFGKNRANESVCPYVQKCA